MLKDIQLKSRWPYLWLAACLLAALYVLTFPLQDLDTFWHLAYGRAMVESRTFINHEIFSFTAPGTYLGSHSQLAQVILYGLWSIGGAAALIGFKFLVAAVVYVLLVGISRSQGAELTVGATLALVVLLAGMTRMVERPELFSILMQTALVWILFRAHRAGYNSRTMWMMPLLMVAWDYLHGAIYGLLVLVMFAVAESGRYLLEKRRRRLGAAPNGANVNKLLVWVGITLVAMALHPNGLIKLTDFLHIEQSPEFRMYGEWMTPTPALFPWYYACLVLVIILLLFRGCATIAKWGETPVWPRPLPSTDNEDHTHIPVRLVGVDYTSIAILLPFVYLSLKYNRATLAFCIAATPFVARSLVAIRQLWGGGRLWQVTQGLLAFAVLIASVSFKQWYVKGPFLFGFGIFDTRFPTGSVRFIQDNNLSGHFYNSDIYGGYLAFFLGPERKIFHYNQPGVFNVLQDFLHKPESREQWQINYAIVGRKEELSLFKDGYVPVYSEPNSTIYLKVAPENRALIEQFQLRYFQPMLSGRELIALGQSAASAKRLLAEVSVYLSYRSDPRVAGVFSRLLQQSVANLEITEKIQLLRPVMKHNAESAALHAVQGELLFQSRAFDNAMPSFTKALDLDPDNYSARLGLGYIAYEQGRYDTAVEYFSRLVTDYPQSADAYYAVGLVSMKLCQAERAANAFREFLKLAPNSPYVNKVRAYLDSGAVDSSCRS